jgi:hypothetical protein
VEAAIWPFTVEEKPEEMLNQDKSLGAIDKTSEEASWALKEVRNEGRKRRRRRGEKEKGEEEVVDFITSSSTAWGRRGGVFW